MVRADHPNNVKREGVCAYVRESLPVRNFSNSYLSECLTLEVTISNKKGLLLYIDLLVIDSGIHPSLHQNCYHQVIFCKLNLKIEYPQPYTREVWDYGKAQTDLINRAIDQFDWVNLFLDTNINEKVILVNRTILNIFHNFIPNKMILCDDRDLPWMNERIKQFCQMIYPFKTFIMLCRFSFMRLVT